MKKVLNLSQECNTFSASRIDNIAWIERKGNMRALLDLQKICYRLTNDIAILFIHS